MLTSTLHLLRTAEATRTRVESRLAKECVTAAARFALRTLLILNLAPSALACLTLRHPRYRFVLRESFRTKLFNENQLHARNKASRDMRQAVKVLMALEAEAEAETARYRAHIKGVILHRANLSNILS